MKKDYFIFKSGDLKRKDFNIVLVTEEGNNILPLNTIDNIFIFSKININSDCINYLGEMNINVHFYDHYDNFRSSLSGVGMQHSGNTHISQATHYLDNDKRLYIASQFIKSAIWSMNKNLMEYNIGYSNDEIKDYYDKLDNCISTNEIMGIEGNFRKNYYEKFDIIIKKFKFVKRSKRPPLNEINALISFGNSLVYNYCLNAIKQTYLNSTISFLHECGDRRHSLCLDLAEIFKPIIVDRVIFKLVNNSSLKSCHFDLHDTFCLLKEEGKKIFIKEIEDKLKTTFFHRKLNKNVSYKGLIKLEAYRLCKHIMGVENYESLKINW